MKNKRFLLTIVALLLLSVSLVLASCNGGGETTTEAPEITDDPVTEAPADTSEEETTAEITEEETTDAPEETTDVPEETTSETEDTAEPSHVHSFGEWNVTKAATCTEAGTEERVCSCGEKETASIAALGHTEGEWIIDKEATADADGSKHQVCASCGVTLKTEIIPATPHTPGEWITDKDATCTEDGYKHQVCSECGVTIASESIPKKGHTEVTDAAVSPTCTENGLTAGKHCSVCNEVITAQTSVPAKGHNEVADAAVAPTCTESGFTEGKYCSVCDAVIKAPEIIPSKGGHAEGEWIIDKEATTSSTGSKHTECTVCGATLKTETIPVLEIVKIEYSVTITDSFGNPVSDVKVTFMSGDTAVAEASTDASGKAAVKLAEGDYDVIPDVGDSYVSTSAKLTASAPTSEIMLVCYATNPQYVYPGATDTDTVSGGVYDVQVGSVCVPVEKGKIRYLFFAPTEGAVYHVYTDSDKVEVGYYGGSFFVTSTNSGVYDESGALILEVLHSSVGNKMVIGLTSTSATVDECIFTIVRASDIEIKDVERPWEQYVPTQVPDKQVETPSGTLKYVPIEINYSTMSGMKEIQVVYNENDGYYHLETADGPVLYVRITQSTKYLDALKGIVSLTNIGKYFYDDDGKLVKKESYVDAIYIDKTLQPNNTNKYYSAVADKKYGVVPLNSELIYILKNVGEDDWYDISSPDYIFDNNLLKVQVLPQNAWLFAVVYFD